MSRGLPGHPHRTAPSLHQDDLLAAARLRAALQAGAPADAAAQLRRATPAAVVWLEPCHGQSEPVTEDDRKQLRAALDRVVAEGTVIEHGQQAWPTAGDGSVQGGHLCGQCGGRCCQPGAGWHAFIDITLLQQWQAEHAGRSLDDAVQACLDRLPAEHIHGSCLYHTLQGCAVPRDQRSAICNRYACDALQQVQALAAADAGVAVVALTMERRTLHRASVIDAGGRQPFDPALPALNA